MLLSACAPYILEGLGAVDESETLEGDTDISEEAYEGFIGPVIGTYRWQGRGIILKVDENTVTVILDDEEVESGIYEIEGDEHIITMDGATVRADSFVQGEEEFIKITSGDGLLGMLSGVILQKLTGEESRDRIDSRLASIEDELNHAEPIVDSENSEVYSSSTLNGDYTAEMFVGLNRTLRFEGDTVTTIFDDQEANVGTYEIDGNELIITIDGLNIRAHLSADGESFIVTSADSLLGMIYGITFTQEN